jgi:hypothetical protein
MNVVSFAFNEVEVRPKSLYIALLHCTWKIPTIRRSTMILQSSEKDCIIYLSKVFLLNFVCQMSIKRVENFVFPIYGNIKTKKRQTSKYLSIKV